MLDLLTSRGFVRRWTLVDGFPRCIEDALDPLDPFAADAYGKSVYIDDLLTRDSEYPPAPPEDATPDWEPPAIEDDVAALRRVKAGAQSEEDEEHAAAVALLEDRIANALPVENPIIPPETISDQQFAFGLAMAGRITQEEAFAFATIGTLPADLEAFVETISDPVVKWMTKMSVAATKEFRRSHPLVDQIRQYFGMSAREVDALWLRCSRI